MCNPSHHAFTLMEMLVVISIITLLLAITQPSLRSAREVSRRAVCGTQARQVGIAFTGYTDDNRRYPGSGGGGYAKATTAPWVNCENGHYFNGHPANPVTGVIYPYIRDPAVYLCPSDTGRSQYHPTFAPQTISHTMPLWWEYRKTENVHKPTETMLLVESGNSRCVQGNKPDDSLYIPNWMVYDMPTDRHLGESATIVLADNHVEWRKWDNFSVLSVDYFMIRKP